MTDGTIGLQNPRRFSWLVGTLATCHQPSRMENIKFMILIWDVSLANHLPWHNLDALFAQYPGGQWPRLKHFIIQHFDENKGKVKEESIEDIILPRTPFLAAANLLRITTSGEYLRFWKS